MQPLKTYDYLTRARARLLDWARPLTPDQHAQTFPIGPGSLLRILTHTLISESYYVQRMTGAPVLPYAQWPIKDENPPPLAVLESEWTLQADRTRAAIASIRDWTSDLTYEVTDDHGARLRITASPGDIFTQLVLHEVHHRAQAMNILRQFGIAAEDLDYNAIMFRRETLST